jgi:uncharacterized protein (DUF3820 family)
MNDNSIMPWGKYQGEKMVNVPASYLIWLHENNKCSGEVKTYIIENLDVLKQQQKSR